MNYTHWDWGESGGGGGAESGVLGPANWTAVIAQSPAAIGSVATVAAASTTIAGYKLAKKYVFRKAPASQTDPEAVPLVGIKKDPPEPVEDEEEEMVSWNIVEGPEAATISSMVWAQPMLLQTDSFPTLVTPGGGATTQAPSDEDGDDEMVSWNMVEGPGSSTISSMVWAQPMILQPEPNLGSGSGTATITQAPSQVQEKDPDGNGEEEMMSWNMVEGPDSNTISSMVWAQPMQMYVQSKPTLGGLPTYTSQAYSSSPVSFTQQPAFQQQPGDTPPQPPEGTSSEQV